MTRRADRRRLIDADVHCAPASIDALAPYLDDYWRDYVANAGLRLAPHVGGAYPPAAGPRAAQLTSTRCAEQLLDPRRPAPRDPQLPDASTPAATSTTRPRSRSAVNDWLRAEWLERDDRLRAYARRADARPRRRRRGDRADRRRRRASCRCCCRCAARRRGATSATTDLYEAAAKHDLVLGLHAWGRPGQRADLERLHALLPRGLPRPTRRSSPRRHVLSLVSEGVFERVPALRVSCWSAASRGCRRCSGASTRTGRPSGARCRGSRSSRRPTCAATSARRPRRRTCPPTPQQAAQLVEMLGAERHARVRERLPARARRRASTRCSRRSTTPVATRSSTATRPRSTVWPARASSPPGPGRAARSGARGDGARDP